MNIRVLVIVGVGLIGGSIGLAAKRRGLAERVIGVGRKQSSLDRALASGAIDEACLDAGEAMSRADLGVFCTPVDLIAEQIQHVASKCRAETLLTDAGSVKSVIVQKVEDSLGNGVHFVGSHP